MQKSSVNLIINNMEEESKSIVFWGCFMGYIENKRKNISIMEDFNDKKPTDIIYWIQEQLEQLEKDNKSQSFCMVNCGVIQ